MEKHRTFINSHTTFAKIVATPTTTAWSQAYTAGSLCALFALTTTQETAELALIGKEIINTLEEEFFTLEVKKLTAIKQALTTTVQKIPPVTSATIVVAFIPTVPSENNETAIYVYVYGNGVIFLKRADKFGTLLGPSNMISASSGFLKKNDILILQTQQFGEIVSASNLSSSLTSETPADIAEILTPQIHNTNDGAASAIIVKFQKEETTTEMSSADAPPIPSLAPVLEPPSIHASYESPKSSKQPLLQLKIPIQFSALSQVVGSVKENMNHTKKMFFTIACILIIVLIASVYFAVKKQEDTKIQQEFTRVYTEALKKYDEGQALASLNKNLAQEDFEAAKKLLEESKSKFRPGSSQEKQLTGLLAKVEVSLAHNQSDLRTRPKEVDASVSQLLAYEVKTGVAASSFAHDDKAFYTADIKSIQRVDKETNKAKQIITNDDDWKSLNGMDVYFNNIYIVDASLDTILKFVPTEKGFAKTNYLSSLVTADLSKAVSLAIDGSLFVLSSNGSIQKFTRGKPDTFALSGLDKGLTNPKKIFTHADINNLYVLDNGNSRIVVLNKQGAYVSSYQSSVLKNAKDIEVSEKDKKIFVLVDKKVYQIDLQ